MRVKKYISYVLRFAVAAGAFYWAFRGEKIGDISRLLLGINIWVFIAALALYFVSQLFFVVRWRLLLGVQSITIGFWPAFNLLLLGLFYNNCLPSAVGGDVLRAWYVSKHTDKKVEAVISVFVDRFIGLAGTIILAVGSYCLIPVKGEGGGLDFSFKFGGGLDLAGSKGPLLWSAAAIILICGVCFGHKGCRGAIRRKFAYVYDRAFRVFREGRAAIMLYCRHWTVLLSSLLLTFCCQGIFIVGLWFLGRQVNAAMPVKYYFVFFPMSWVLGMLPISIGGAGVVEWWLKAMFVRIGLSGEVALVLALFQRLLWLIGSLPGAVIHLVGAHLPKEFFVDDREVIS